MNNLYEKLQFYCKNKYMLSVNPHKRELSLISQMLGDIYFCLYMDETLMEEKNCDYDWKVVIKSVDHECNPKYKEIIIVSMWLFVGNGVRYLPSALGLNIHFNDEQKFNSVFKFEIPLKEKINLL